MKIIKKILFIFFLIILITTFAGCSSTKGKINDSVKKSTDNNEGVEKGLKNYLNNDFGVKFSYPSTYQKVEDFMGVVVLLKTPKENYSDIFQENFNVVIQDMKQQAITLDEYKDIVVVQLKQVIEDVNIISTEKVTLANNSAYKVIFTGKQGQYNLKWMQIFSVINDSVYVLSYTAEIEKYEIYLEPISLIVESFEIGKKF